MPEGATRWYRAWRITDFGLARPEGVVARVGPGGSVERTSDSVNASPRAAGTTAALEPPPLLQAVATSGSEAIVVSTGTADAVVADARLADAVVADAILDDSSEGEPAVADDGEEVAVPLRGAVQAPAHPRSRPASPTPRVPFRLVGAGPDSVDDCEVAVDGVAEAAAAAAAAAARPRPRPARGTTQPVGATVDLLLKQTLEIQGLKTDPEPGEKLVGTIAQDPTDVLVCGWGAFLSKLRGAVVATNRRIFICRPRGTGMEYHALELDSVARISLEQRLIWRRLLTVIALVAAAFGLGAWAAFARTPLNYAMAAEGATAFGIAAALTIVACIMAGRMRHPALVVRCTEGSARETFDLPCQRADRHVVMRMAALVRRAEPREAHDARGLGGVVGELDAPLTERTERDSRGRRRSIVEPSSERTANDSSQWGDVGEVMPLEDYLKNRAAG